jgi:hypothetical protein
LAERQDGVALDSFDVPQNRETLHGPPRALALEAILNTTATANQKAA